MWFLKERCAVLTVLMVLSSVQSLSAQDSMPVILSMQERAEVVNRLLGNRLDTVVPMLMRRENIDMWIISAREYNEDPIIETMLPATWLAARRRTILVFYDTGSESERYAIARYDVGSFFPSAWDPEKQPDQWDRLAELIKEKKPDRIAINRSSTFATADGMTDTEYDQFLVALPENYHARIVTGERLAVGWLETRTEAEMQIYPMICKIAHQIIAEGFSEKVIHPGVTTTEDVEWWYRERIRDLNLVTWFHPSVSIQRAEAPDTRGTFSSRPTSDVIMQGDLLHVDFGITYLRLNTDTQQHAYVLKPGETEAPVGLTKALAVGNRLQDILTGYFIEGHSGNEILQASRERAIAEGITPSIYTHPIGFHGHGAGPTIGLWDQQGGVPGRGDYPLYANTAYSIELNARTKVEEWNNKEVRIMLEEDAFFDGTSTWYIDGRQEELLLIPRQP